MLKGRTCGKKDIYVQTPLCKLSHKRDVFIVRFVIFGLKPLSFVMYFMADRPELFPGEKCSRYYSNWYHRTAPAWG